jgi:hypothetical protein
MQSLDECFTVPESYYATPEAHVKVNMLTSQSQAKAQNLAEPKLTELMVGFPRITAICGMTLWWKHP